MILWEKILNALMIITLMFIVLGSLVVQFFYHEEPCPLCLLQRLAMLSIASAALLNIYSFPRKLHYGLILMAAFFGGFVALRHIALNICSSSPFGNPLWGLSLYTWAFFTFVCVVLAVAIFLILFDKNHRSTLMQVSTWHWVPLALLLFTALLNIYATWHRCGFNNC